MNESDPPALITSFRVNCTKFLEYTGHRRIFWKRLGHKQTSRPCLSWMHLPRIAQNLTQSLVKSYVVPYNKQTKVHTAVSLTSWPLSHIANLPSPDPPHLFTLFKPHQHFDYDSNICSSYSVFHEMPFHTTAAKEPHLLQNLIQKEPLP